MRPPLLSVNKHIWNFILKKVSFQFPPGFKLQIFDTCLANVLNSVSSITYQCLSHLTVKTGREGVMPFLHNVVDIVITLELRSEIAMKESNNVLVAGWTDAQWSEECVGRTSYNWEDWQRGCRRISMLGHTGQLHSTTQIRQCSL